MPVLKPWAVLALLLASSTAALAAHPLITDDAGTQGQGGFQVEINAEYGDDDEDGVEERGSEVAGAISYGIGEAVDLVLGLPYLHIRSEEAGATSTADGLGDLSLEAKWRLLDRDRLGLAIKPGLTLPTGDEEEGLGTGRATWSVFAILSQEFVAAAVHLNLGALGNENKLDERHQLWHASLAAELELGRAVKAVANVGAERNPDPASGTAPAFALAGLIWAVSDNLDLDCGIKAGLTDPEVDVAYLAGLAWRH
ncbi:MAG: transporter [Thermodesulfobacteriota bacterium]